MTERLLVANGWLCGSTESYNAHSGYSKDFLGFADFIAIHPFDGRIAAIQVTTAHNRNARRAKILAAIEAYLCCLGGMEIWLLTWKLDNLAWEPRGRTWRPKVERIYGEEFSFEFRDKAAQYWKLRGAVALKDIKEHKIKTQFEHLRDVKL